MVVEDQTKKAITFFHLNFLSGEQSVQGDEPSAFRVLSNYIDMLKDNIDKKQTIWSFKWRLKNVGSGPLNNWVQQGKSNMFSSGFISSFLSL